MNNLAHIKLSSVVIFSMLCSTILWSNLSWADEELPETDPSYVKVVEQQNPSRDAGFVIGDLLERKLAITVKAPYELISESLPIVGYEHRYRGQVSGVELTKISTQVQKERTQNTYNIHLTYQVFKAARTVKPAILRGEIIKLRNTKTKAVTQVRVPHFNFRISPLSVYGEVNLKNELYPYILPIKLEDKKERLYLNIASIALALSLLGLLYIFGAYTLLPNMGGPFAKAYRFTKKQTKDEPGLKATITHVHQAIDKVAGQSVFANTIDDFVQNHPQFLPMQQEIAAFFMLSRQVFFDPYYNAVLDHPPAVWLKRFCRQMRDCERGLSPNLKHVNTVPDKVDA